MQDRVKQNRKNSLWGFPLGVVLLIANVQIIIDEIIPNILDILGDTSSARTIALTPLIITMPAFSMAMIFAMIANSIPCSAETIKRTERALIAITGVNILSVLVSLAVITPLQYYAMPKLGYTRCNILEGHPNMYFTDWVKNPDWCVRGKSREWVRQQARMAGAQG